MMKLNEAIEIINRLSDPGVVSNLPLEFQIKLVSETINFASEIKKLLLYSSLYQYITGDNK